MGSKAETITNAVRIYRTLAEIPTINCGNFLNTGNSDFVKVSSIWSQRNIELGEITKFRKDFVLEVSSSQVIYESPPVDTSTQELSRTTDSERFACIIRKTKVDNKSKQFIEIWTQRGLYKNFDVSAFDVHGEVYTDGEFGTLEWSPDEDKVLYIAEQKTNKSLPFYTQKSDEKQSGKGDILGDEYIYKPDWGEQLVDKHQPVIGICNVKMETLSVLKGIPPNFSPGQVLWSRDGKTIFGVVLENEPRRLGLVYCTNRLSYIFQMSLGGEFKILSEANQSVRSPRLSPNGKSLFWLQRPCGGVHNGCQELVKHDLTSNKRVVVIEMVQQIEKNFSGLFLHELPRRCFSKDGSKLVFNSCNKFKNSSYCLDIDKKDIRLLETGEGSSTILDFYDDFLLLSIDSLQYTPALRVSKSIAKLDLIPLTNSEMVHKNSVLKELEFQSKTGSYKFAYYNALYYGPPVQNSSSQKVPLILMPHGGPHSAFTNSYGLEPNFLVNLGYGVLMINYRGSTGVGQKGVEFLPGKIGDTDVKDCHEAMLQVLKIIPQLDDKNVFLSGGSHGGFLVVHLSAQYPSSYRAVAARNPVINVSAMYSMSDIPDWASSECSQKFNEALPLTNEQINKMVSSSPIALVDKIKVPTLLLIGKKDLRVPFYEGLKMYHSLKARKVKVRMNLYDDNHTLGKVPNHIDYLIHMALWFLENRA